MKSNSHLNLYAAFIIFLLSSFTIASCKKNIVETAREEENNMASAAKPSSQPNSLATVSLKVTVVNTEANGSAMRITNDAKGVYINGIDNVQAILDQYGTFAFNTQASSRKAAVRWVAYDFNDPVDPTNTYRPSPSNNTNYHFSTGGSSYTPFTPLQNLGINGNPVSTCMYMGNGISNSTTSWRVSFHKGYENTQDSPTAFAVATRTKTKSVDGIDEWTISPTGECSPNSNIAALRSGDGIVLHGYYRVPFYFILRAQ